MSSFDARSDALLPEPAPTPIRFQLPERVVVVGDLNGHVRLLDQLLEGTGLIDGRGRWVGEDALLVQIGDVVNRGSSSRAAVDRILRLRAAARERGGDVVWLLGNHEVMTTLGHEAYVTADEYLEFAYPSEIAAFHDARTRFIYELLGPPDVARRVGPIGGRLRAWEEDHAPGRAAFRAAFGPEGIYGRHLRSLPLAVQIGPLLFVHGGLAPQWAELGLDGLEIMAKEAWGRQPTGYQALDPNGVFRDPLGPLWHRAYCVSEARAVAADVERALGMVGAERMVVGHTRTETVMGGENGRPLLRQGGRVLMVDVGIGEPGEPGAALIVEEGRIDAWSPVHGRFEVAPSLGPA